MGSLVAIDIGVLNDDLRPNTCIALSVIGAVMNDTLDDTLANVGAVQAKIEKARCGNSDLLNGRGPHISQDRRQRLRPGERLTGPFLLASPPPYKHSNSARN